MRMKNSPDLSWTLEASIHRLLWHRERFKVFAFLSLPNLFFTTAVLVQRAPQSLLLWPLIHPLLSRSRSSRPYLNNTIQILSGRQSKSRVQLENTISRASTKTSDKVIFFILGSILSMPFQLFKFAHGSSCSSAIANDNGLDEWELIRSDDLQELLESEPVAKTGTAGNEMDINMQKWEMVTPDEPKELLRPESSPVISNNISNEGGDPYEWEFILSDDLEDAPQNGSSVTADFAGNDANFDAREWELVPTDDNDEFMNPDITISDNVLNEKEIHVREFETVISNGLNSAKPEVLITTDHVAYEKDFDNVGHCPLGKPIPVDDIDDKAEQKPLVGIGYVLAGVEELPKMSLGAVDSVFDDGMDELLGDRPNRYWISEHRKKRDVEAENNKYPAIVLGIFGNWRTYVYKFVEKIRTFCWSGTF